MHTVLHRITAPIRARGRAVGATAYPRRRLTLAVLALSMAFAGLGASPAFADCPNPSWVQVVTDGGRLDSRAPNQTVGALEFSRITHWGDVQPGSRATFTYDSFDDTTGLRIGSKQHQTQPSRSNGVIHHEPEFRILADLLFPSTDFVVVRASFTDECGRGTVNAQLGTIRIIR